MADNQLKDIYKSILSENNKKHDITSSTVSIIDKAQPRSPVVRSYEAELFGLSEEDLKKLPIKAVEMFHSALKYLLNATEKEPRLRSALRSMINTQFEEMEDEEENEKEKMKESFDFISTFNSFLKQLTENVSLTQMDKLADTDADTLNTSLYTKVAKELEIAPIKGVNMNTPNAKKLVQAVLSALIKDAEACKLKKYLWKIVNYTPEQAPVPTDTATPAPTETQAPQV